VKIFVLFVSFALLISAFAGLAEAHSVRPDVFSLDFASGPSPFSSGITASQSSVKAARMPTVINRRAANPTLAGPSISGLVVLRASDLRPLGGVINELGSQPIQDYRLLLSPQPVANWFIGGLKKDTSRLGALSCGNLSASDAAAFAFVSGFRVVLVNGTSMDGSASRNERFITHFALVFSDEAAASRAFGAWNASVAAEAAKCWTAWPDKKTKPTIATNPLDISLAAHGSESHAFAYEYQNRYAEGTWAVRAVAFRSGNVLHVIRLTGAQSGTNDAQLDAYAYTVEKKGAA